MAITDIETMTEALNRAAARGYKAQFRAVDGGLYSKACGTRHVPETMIIDDIERFEGTTDPGAEEILFVLRCPQHGTKGTYSPAYGPLADGADQEMISRLHLHRNKNQLAAGEALPG